MVLKLAQHLGLRLPLVPVHVKNNPVINTVRHDGVGSFLLVLDGVSVPAGVYFLLADAKSFCPFVSTFYPASESNQKSLQLYLESGLPTS